VSGLLGYQYVALRCVPRVDRDEFVNVGVVLHSQLGDFLGARFRLDPARLQALSADVDLAAVERALQAIAAVCRGDRAAGLPDLAQPGPRFGWVSAPRSTVVQPGPVHGGLTSDPARELDRLLERLVG